MIPVLYDIETTTFAGNGLGLLVHAISCTVTEQLVQNGDGGIYSLEMSYPANAPLAALLNIGAVVYAIPSPHRAPEPFRIYRRAISPEGQLDIFANHISYDLTYTPVLPFAGSGVANALATLNASIPSSLRRFVLDTDSGQTGDFAFPMVSNVRDALGGANGVAQAYGLDIMWSGWTVALLTHRGSTTPKKIYWNCPAISYGIDYDSTDAIDGVLPYWISTSGEDGGMSGVFGSVVYWRNAAPTNPKIEPLDCSAAFDSAPTQAQLEETARDFMAGDKPGGSSIYRPRQTVEVTLSQPSGGLFSVPELDLGDEIQLVNVPAGYFGKTGLRVTSVMTDVLAEHYTAIGIGDEPPNVSYTIAALESSGMQFVPRG